MTCTPHLSYWTLAIVGRMNARDFPEPVSASEIIEMFEWMIGIAYIWTGVG